jgi:hypothetical protein
MKSSIVDPVMQEMWLGLYWDAHYTAEYMTESWRPRCSKEPTVEGVALRHAVRLDLLCEQGLDVNSRHNVVPIASNLAEPEVRYRAEAAMRLIHAAVPFAVDRDALRRELESDAEAWVEKLEREEAGAFGRWHRWLWPSHLSQPPTEAAGDHGESTVVAMAARDLANQLEVIAFD